MSSGSIKKSSCVGLAALAGVCEKWRGKYQRFASLNNEPRYRAGFTSLNYGGIKEGATHVAGDPGSATSLRYALSGMTGFSRTHPDLIGRRCGVTLLGHVAMDKRCYRRKVPN
ncbi:MAG: hypothetical protein FH748_08535 [Balneolaceae bacterium]|nr:hypothetical protein [Balneolaceae bacterium]